MYTRQLSLQHWHTIIETIVYNHPLKEISNFVPMQHAACQRRKVKRKHMKTSCLHHHLSNIIQIKNVSYCLYEIIRLLYIMFETILRQRNSLYHSREYGNSLRCLESRINNIIPSAREDIADTMSDLNKTWVATLELYKLTALIYLKRASRNFSGISAQINIVVETAYIILGSLETFDLAFPLLIVGCEARADDRRMSILEHIERARKTSSLRSLHRLQSILQQIWVQDDLAVDHELDYLKKLEAVITSFRIIPTFA